MRKPVAATPTNKATISQCRMTVPLSVRNGRSPALPETGVPSLRLSLRISIDGTLPHKRWSNVGAREGQPHCSPILSSKNWTDFRRDHEEFAARRRQIPVQGNKGKNLDGFLGQRLPNLNHADAEEPDFTRPASRPSAWNWMSALQPVFVPG
jgi:hypothetical protein